MRLIQNGFSCEREMQIFMNLFFKPTEEGFIFMNLTHKNGVLNVYTEIIYQEEVYFYDYFDNYPFESENISEKKLYVYACTKSFVGCAEKIRQIQLPWGIMSGIRPAKYVREFMEQGHSINDVRRLFNYCGVYPKKTDLAMTVAENEKAVLSQRRENAVSLYIGIPFCPTRCLYCSFVSTDVRISGKYMESFVDHLVCEIYKTKEVLDILGMDVENIYIGGGTPTTLSAGLLQKIFSALNECFDRKKIREFTLEAGRPDTITPEKLDVAKKGGADRISINPQTMHGETLQKIGRAHTPRMVSESFWMARKAGFENINMDLIAGLPDESPAMFRESIDQVALFDPENITVHSMCKKRAAALRFSDVELTEENAMNAMLDYTQEKMEKMGYLPYYMYRQKNISGNLENVSYAKPGYFSFYNVNIMEEVQTIVALGGGGSTKLVMGDRIERIFNFKEPLEYIRRFTDILKKKDQILKIMQENGFLGKGGEGS